MNAIRIKRHLDSETLRLPELRPLLGKDVEIIVLEEVRTKPAKKKTETKAARKRRLERELDAMAAAQGVKPVTDYKQLMGGWPKEELDDGFEEDLNRRRKSEIVPDLKE